MAVQAHQLRARVDIKYSSADTGEVTGGFDKTPATRASNVPALLEPASASAVERRIGNQVVAPISHLVTLRYRSDVRITDWIVYCGRTFHIRGLQNLEERNVWLVLACEERVT